MSSRPGNLPVVGGVTSSQSQQQQGTNNGGCCRHRLIPSFDQPSSLYKSFGVGSTLPPEQPLQHSLSHRLPLTTTQSISAPSFGSQHNTNCPSVSTPTLANRLLPPSAVQAQTITTSVGLSAPPSTPSTGFNQQRIVQTGGGDVDSLPVPMLFELHRAICRKVGPLAKPGHTLRAVSPCKVDCGCEGAGQSPHLRDTTMSRPPTTPGADVNMENKLSEIKADLVRILGQDPYDWETKLANREMFDNVALGRKVFLCLKPLLSRNTHLLRSDHIMDALRREESKYDEMFQHPGHSAPLQTATTTPSAATNALLHPAVLFRVYGPFEAGYRLQPADISYGQTTVSQSTSSPSPSARFFAFVLNTGLFRGKAGSSMDADRGSHWVVLLVDTVEGESDYYDCLGHPPSLPMQITVQSIFDLLSVKLSQSSVSSPPTTPATVQARWPNLNFRIRFTETPKQDDGDSCALYVVHFVAERLKGKSFAQFDAEFIPSQVIKRYRNVYWKEIRQDIF